MARLARSRFLRSFGFLLDGQSLPVRDPRVPGPTAQLFWERSDDSGVPRDEDSSNDISTPPFFECETTQDEHYNVILLICQPSEIIFPRKIAA
jgi:hypothetical protein